MNINHQSQSAWSSVDGVGRRILLLAIVVSAFAMAGWVGLAASAAASATLEPADAAAQQLAGPGGCVVRGSAFIADDAGDGLASDLAAGSGWLVAGSRFRGDLASAAAALNGQPMSFDSSEAWVSQVSSDGRQFARQLRRVGSDGNLAVWLVGDSLRAVDCP